ncbi:MAG: hypothetical protein ACR2KU_05775 [Gammaproteobacteria bacterium]
MIQRNTTAQYQSEAQAYLDTGDLAADTSDWETRLQAMRREREVMTRALRLQEQRIAHLEGELSADIRKPLRPAYQSHAQTMIKTAEELARLCREEQTFRNVLNARGIHFQATMPILTCINLLGAPQPPPENSQALPAFARLLWTAAT